jgi:hypothetical protein
VGLEKPISTPNQTQQNNAVKGDQIELEEEFERQLKKTLKGRHKPDKRMH